MNIQKWPAVQWTLVLSDHAQHMRKQPFNEQLFPERGHENQMVKRYQLN